MGFIKAVDFKGFTPKYWNISTIADNKADNTTKVTVSLYKDKATRTAQPAATIAALTFTLEGCDMKRAEIYPIIKDIQPDELSKTPGPAYFSDATPDND